jgi:hypothetical protein
MDFWTFLIMFLLFIAATCVISIVQANSYKETVRLLLDHKTTGVTKPRKPEAVAEETERVKATVQERKKRLLA